VIEAIRGTITDEFEAFTDDFGAVSLRSLAIVETAANIEVRSIEKEGIIKITEATIL
jgi:hypothetical protein